MGIHLQQVTAVALQSDGKILVTGWGDTLVSANQQAFLVRLLANGDLDTVSARMSIGRSERWRAFSLAGFLPAELRGRHDGHHGWSGIERILLAGTPSARIGNRDFAVFAFDTTGGLELQMTIDFPVFPICSTGYIGHESVTRMLVQPDGSVLLAGYLDDFGAGVGFALAKLTPGLNRDPNFGNDGRVITTGVNATRIEGIAVQSDGSIVVAGGTNAGMGGFLLARYIQTTGALDPTFDASDADPTDDLLIIEPPLTATSVQPRDLAIQADGKIVIIGDDFNPNLSLGIATARIHPNGTNDAAFSAADMAFFQPGWQARTLRIQADGKILIGGKSVIRGETDFALLRLEGDPITVNTPPVANDDFFFVLEDTPRDLHDGGVPFWGNDEDADGDFPLTPQIVSGPAFGTLEQSGTGVDTIFTYTPKHNFFGNDQITYQVEDTRGGVSNVAIITLIVLAESDPPLSVDVLENTRDVVNLKSLFPPGMPIVFELLPKEAPGSVVATLSRSSAMC